MAAMVGKDQISQHATMERRGAQGPPTLAEDLLTADDSGVMESQCSLKVRLSVGQQCFSGQPQTRERRSSTEQNKVDY